MHGAIDRLLGDAALHRRLADVSAVVQSWDGVAQAASHIERVDLSAR
jgi:hypothetical protein